MFLPHRHFYGNSSSQLNLKNSYTVVVEPKKYVFENYVFIGKLSFGKLRLTHISGHSVLARLFRLPWKRFILEPFVLSLPCDNVRVILSTLVSTSPR